MSEKFSVFAEWDPNGTVSMNDQEVNVLHRCRDEYMYEWVDIYSPGKVYECPGCGVKFVSRINVEVFVIEQDAA